MQKSDRIELVQSANDFVDHMLTKQVYPRLMSCVMARKLEMSVEETETYKSSLSFLHRHSIKVIQMLSRSRNALRSMK